MVGMMFGDETIVFLTRSVLRKRMKASFVRFSSTNKNVVSSVTSFSHVLGRVQSQQISDPLPPFLCVHFLDYEDQEGKIPRISLQLKERRTKSGSEIPECFKLCEPIYSSTLAFHTYLNQYIKMMKTAILAAILGSAAAFAPSQQVCAACQCL